MSTLSKETIEQLAEHLENAELEAYEVTKITDDYPDMDFEDASDIQWEIRRRKEARGTRIVGLKMGLTSWAKMKQMGVDKACYGFLADYFSCPEGSEIDTSRLIHPKVEAEIAFVTKKALRGPGCHIGDVLAATDFILPAIEVIDSRYKDFKFDITSVQADNSSSSRFITGGKMALPQDVDMRTLGVVMEKNGEIVEVAAGAAVLGHPAASVAMLANMFAERGEEIPAGTFIMTGGVTAAVLVEPVELKLFFNFRSPYCYIASKFMFEVFDNYHAKLVWRPLGGWTGRSSPDRAKVKVPITRQDVARITRRMGIPMNPPPISTEPTRAGAGSLLAEQKGVLRPYIVEMMRKEWAEGQDIGETEIILQVGEEVGLERGELEEVLDSEGNLAQLEKNWEEAQNLGVLVSRALLLARRYFGAVIALTM